MMREKGVVVWLCRPLEDMIADVRQDTRPNLAGDKEERMRTLYAQRAHLYEAAAHLQFDNRMAAQRSGEDAGKAVDGEKKMTLFMLAAYGFICAAVYHLCPAQIRWAVLLLASYGFYASRSLAGLPFILLTTVSTWLAALVIAQIGENGKAQTNAADRERKKAIKAQTRRRQRAAMLAALLLNFGLLAALKYTDDVRGWFGASPLGLLLPLGISFYTFQSMGYLLDVYNGKYAPQKNLARFALFVSFFPS